MSVRPRSHTCDENVMQFREAKLMQELGIDDTPANFELRPLVRDSNQGSLEDILSKTPNEIYLGEFVNVVSRLAIFKAHLDENELDNLRGKIALIPKNSVTPEVKLFCDMHSIPVPGTVRGSPPLEGIYTI
jgi:hypothetical protein